MRSLLPRLAITLALLAFAALLPATVGAQAYQYLGQWGAYGSGPGQFSGAWGVATDASGNVYVVDGNNYRIQKFTSAGAYVTQWGSVGSGNGQFGSAVGVPPMFVSFGRPTGVATDASGNVYVADDQNFRIQKFTSAGAYITQWGSWGTGSGQFQSLSGVATDGSGNVYVADYINGHITKFTSAGAFITQWGARGIGAGGLFMHPRAIATDASGNVYVTDWSTYNIQKFTSEGLFLAWWGYAGNGDGQFGGPAGGVAMDASGSAYVVDEYNSRIQKFTSAGAYITQWGSYGTGSGQFGFNNWTNGFDDGVAVDASGNVYVVDAYNNRIQKFGLVASPTKSTTWGGLKALYK